MKHVLVLHSHNLSAGYLAQQRLADPLQMGPNFDSKDVYDDPEGFGKRVTQALQSVDGIQFHHFKRNMPRYDRSVAPTKDDLEYWVEKLKDSLAVGETLDAVVVPLGSGMESETNLSWIRELKQQLPNIKVMVEDPILSYEKPAMARKGRFALPLSEEAQIVTAIRAAVITRDNPQYQLAEGIDVATKNLSGTRLANALRDMLGMARLEEVERGFGR